MPEEDKSNIDDETDEIIAKMLEDENRFYQEVTITSIEGECPYGHKVGDQFKVTTMNSDSTCGSLLRSIFHKVVTLHYGGEVMWEQESGVASGSCSEHGKVKVHIRRVERKD